MNIQRQHTLPENIKNILIIQLGDIGDVVLTTPTLWAVKEAYPEARLSILLREGNGSLLEADPSIYKTYEVKKYPGSFLVKAIRQIGFIRELRQEHFDLVFDLRSDERGAFMSFITGAPIRASPAGGAEPYIFRFERNHAKFRLVHNFADRKSPDPVPRTDSLTFSALIAEFEGVSA